MYVSHLIKKNFLWTRQNEKLCPFQLEPLIAAGAFNEAGGLQFSRVIERSLVDVFVPFLPLERTHVKTCVRNELQRRGIVAGPEVGHSTYQAPKIFPGGGEGY